MPVVRDMADHDEILRRQRERMQEHRDWLQQQKEAQVKERAEFEETIANLRAQVAVAADRESRLETEKLEQERVIQDLRLQVRNMTLANFAREDKAMNEEVTAASPVGKQKTSSSVLLQLDSDDEDDPRWPDEVRHCAGRRRRISNPPSPFPAEETRRQRARRGGPAARSSLWRARARGAR